VDKVGGTDPVLSHQDYAVRALYEYSVGGVVYQGIRVSPWVMLASHNAKILLEKQMRGIDKSEDGSVKVFYNPNYPKKSFLIKPGRIGIMITFILSVAPIWLYWIRYHG